MTGSVNPYEETEDNIDFIEFGTGETPKAQSIVEDLTGNKWLIVQAYTHLSTDYAKAVRIPRFINTYKIVEREL